MDEIIFLEDLTGPNSRQVIPKDYAFSLLDNF